MQRLGWQPLCVRRCMHSIHTFHFSTMEGRLWSVTLEGHTGNSKKSFYTNTQNLEAIWGTDFSSIVTVAGTVVNGH